MSTRTSLNLDVDLQRGVVPISKAASSLAALIKRASTTGKPVIVTQKGYPTGVLLPVDLFTTLKDLAADYADSDGAASPNIIGDLIAATSEDGAPADNEDEAPKVAPKARRSSGHSRKRAGGDAGDGEA